MNMKDLKDIIFEICFNIINGIFTLIPGIALLIFCLFLFFKGAGIIEKVISIPFGFIAIAIIIKALSMILQGINLIIYIHKIKKEDYNKITKIENNSNKLYKTSNISNYIYIIGFLIFWFGFLMIFDYYTIKFWNDNGSQLFFFSLIFWAAGIYIIYKNIRQKK